MDGYSLAPLLLVGFLVWLGYRMLKSFDSGKSKQVYCTTCGSTAASVGRTRGSILIEVVLWLMFIVPGVIYSLWRLTTRTQVCGKCGAATIIPINSPAARKALHSSDAPESRASATPHDVAFTWPATNTIALDVVGESHYQAALRKLARKAETFTALLVPEPTNPHDANAVKVVIDGFTVGYLSRDDAVDFQQILRERGLSGKTTGCEAFLTGGHDLPDGAKASYGVNLDLNPYE